MVQAYRVRPAALVSIPLGRLRSPAQRIEGLQECHQDTADEDTDCRGNQGWSEILGAVSDDSTQHGADHLTKTEDGGEHPDQASRTARFQMSP